MKITLAELVLLVVLTVRLVMVKDLLVLMNAQLVTMIMIVKEP